jgi:predicted ATPase
MAFPEAAIYVLDESGMRRIRYEETEHYLLTRDFLVNRESFLRHLVDGD